MLILLCLSVQITLAVGVSQIQMTVHLLLVRMEANVRIYLTTTSAFVLTDILEDCKYSLNCLLGRQSYCKPICGLVIVHDLLHSIKFNIL